MNIIILCDNVDCDFNKKGCESISFKHICNKYAETGFIPTLFGLELAEIRCAMMMNNLKKVNSCSRCEADPSVCYTCEDNPSLYNKVGYKKVNFNIPNPILSRTQNITNLKKLNKR